MTLLTRVPMRLTQIDQIDSGSRILAQFRPTLEGSADPLSQGAEIVLERHGGHGGWRNPLQTFVQVVLPLSGGILVFIFLNQFIGTYAEFILASILLTGVDQWTVGVMLRSFTTGQFSTKWGIFSAATLGALSIIVLFYGFQGYFVGGTVSGGVKE